MARVVGLLLDLSQAGFAAAVDADLGVRSRLWRPPRTRHDDVGDWVEQGLRQAGGAFSDLEWVCVGVGPGSFTGIRIALAFVQGLAWPRGLPMFGFTSFAALLLSRDSAPGRRAVAAIPANAGRFYAAEGLHDPGVVVDADGLRRRGGPDADLIASHETEELRSAAAVYGSLTCVHDTWDVARVIRHARETGEGPLRPYYLQPSAAEAKAAANAAPAGFTIRPLRPADSSAVAALERVCNPLPWTEDAVTSLAGDGLERRGWVAEETSSGRLAGYLGAGTVADEAEILIAGVDPVFRRRGLGRALLASLREDLSLAGIRAVHLEVRRGNAPALAWYRAAGFTEQGIRRGYYADTGEDALLFALRLRRDLPPAPGFLH